MSSVSAVDPAFDESAYAFELPPPPKPTSPEVVLWIECVGQLLQDATIDDSKIAKAQLRVHLDGDESLVRIRETARALIFASAGATAVWYGTICEMADLDPDFVRMVAERAIKENRRIRKDAFAQAATGKPSTSTIEVEDENL